MAAASPHNLQLTVVFVQYDRTKYGGAAERLIALLEGLDGVDYSLVVVDNGSPGNWFHEVSRKIVHLGGDNRAWEFSAFDKGLAFLEEHRPSCDLYAFATDAYAAYGSEFLGLIDAAVLRAGIELESCFGWIDTFAQPLTAARYYYRDWLRTSLFFVPSGLLPRLTPLETPLERDEIFSDSPASPFRETAPLSDNLKNRLLAWLTTHPTGIELAEVWHSQFELDDFTLGFFGDKVCAILREHLLSARIQYAGIPGYDLRLLHRLVDAGRSPDSVAETAQEAWQWTRWRGADVRRASRFGFDRLELPRTLRHGEPASLRAVGWVVTEPQAEEVAIDLGDHETVGGRVDVPRGDPGSPDPELADRLRGFDLTVPLDRLPPGAYDVTWRVAESPLSSRLGRIDVLPRCAFEPSRSFVPDSGVPGRPLPISLEGRVLSSDRIDRVEVLWNGESTGIEPSLHPEARPASGLWAYRLALSGEATFEGSRLQQRLELRFRTEGGQQHDWRTFKAVGVAEEPPHVLSVRQVGDCDPRSRAVRIRLRGAVLAEGDDDRLILARNQEPLFSERLSRIATRAQGRWWFEVRKVSSAIPLGPSSFSLAVARGESELETLHRWDEQVVPARPRVTLDVARIERLDRVAGEAVAGGSLLSVAGWLTHHRAVDGLALWVDGSEVRELVIDQVRPDVSDHFGQALLRHQGFAVELAMDLEPGPHRVELVAGREPEREVIWTTALEAPAPPGSGFRLVSPRLEELVDGAGGRFESAIQVAGEAQTRITDVDAILLLGGAQVDRQVIASGGGFHLRHVPKRSGVYALRVLFRSGERTLFDTGTVDVEFVRVELPPEPVRTFDTFVRRFELDRLLGLEPSPDLLRRLLEGAGSGAESYLEAIGKLESALELGASRPPGPVITPSPEPLDGPPLDVLFVSWEVPSFRHGGGVCMINILKHLSKKHRITLLCSYARDEEGWVDEARPYAHRVISVLRKDQPSPETFPEVLSHLFQGYVPDLKRAVESEVFTGRYDVVDYHYVSLLPYCSRAAVPQVMTVHEERFGARLADVRQAALQGSSIRRLDELVRAFYLSAVALPRTFPHLIAFTPEDAEAVSRYQESAKVYLNPISVDMATFEPHGGKPHGAKPHGGKPHGGKPHGAKPRGGKPSADEPAADGPPRLVVLGNYRHPPNVASAKFFARHVMPGVWRRFPSAEFHVVGGFPPQELERLAEGEPRIVVSGFVDDYRPHVRQAAAFVAPVFNGSGMRVKVLEGMACGAPVVATRLAMNGIAADDGEHYFAAESAADFVEACCRAIEHGEAARQVGARGRRLIAERYNHERLGDEREAIWREVIADFEASQAADAEAGS